MFHASIIGGEDDAPSPIRLRAPLARSGCAAATKPSSYRGSARRGLICPA